MSNTIRVLLHGLLIMRFIVISGCAKEKVTDEAMEPSTDKSAMGKEESLESKPIGISEGRTSEGMLPVYFDFDSSDIRTDQVSRIEANGDFLREQADANIRIEGNCDPRGTSEYNMALGERRALSAKKYLVNLGISDSKLSTISFGEERLLMHGHDELSWAQNRRADFVIVE